MTTIRTITEAESEIFLRLLCDVFQLDYARASSVFYSEPFYDLKRKWALFHSGRLTSILTTTPLAFGWGNAIGIAGVGTHPLYRNQGHAEKLLQHVLEAAEHDNEGPAILFAHKPVLYERVGFKTIDTVIKGPVRSNGEFPYDETLPSAEIQSRYNAWAEQNPNRLRRDERRWRYWNFIYRQCVPVGPGYIACEATLVREALVPLAPPLPARSPECPPDPWPVPPGTEWFGLKSLTQSLKVPVEKERQELLLMARHFPAKPQLFMTDQF